MSAGAVVGQSGLEYYYDRYLRGTSGERKVEVNAEGQVEPAQLPITAPHPGYSLRLTLDLPLQREGEIALRKGMELAHGNGNPGNGGAFVALNPLNGEVLAMGSYPSFNPNQLIKPLTDRELKAIEKPEGARDRPARDAVRQSRGRRVLSDGLHVQADHRDREPRSGPARPLRAAWRRVVHRNRRRREILQLRPQRLRRPAARGSAQGLLRHLFLHRR